MNLPRRFFACALLAPLLNTGAGNQEIVFAPAAGTQLSRNYEYTFDFELEDFSLVVDGEDVGSLMGGFDLALHTEQSVSVTDLYKTLGEGRPEELIRNFEELSALVNISFMSEFGGEDQDITSSSALEGMKVLFTWNEEDEEYVVSFDGDDGDEDLLEDLTEDMDFRALLPPKEVSEGDQWDVELTELKPVLAPGGNMAMLPEDSEIEDMSALEDIFNERFQNLEDLLDGSWVCTFQGLSAEDARLAEIAIETEVEVSMDLSDVILELVDAFAQEAGEDEIPDISIETADLSLEFEGEGSMIWHVGQARFVSLELSGDVIMSFDLAASVDMMGESHTAELYIELSGSYDQSAMAEE